MKHGLYISHLWMVIEWTISARVITFDTEMSDVINKPSCLLYKVDLILIWPVRKLNFRRIPSSKEIEKITFRETEAQSANSCGIPAGSKRTIGIIYILLGAASHSNTISTFFHEKD